MSTVRDHADPEVIDLDEDKSALIDLNVDEPNPIGLNTSDSQMIDMNIDEAQVFDLDDGASPEAPDVDPPEKWL